MMIVEMVVLEVLSNDETSNQINNDNDDESHNEVLISNDSDYQDDDVETLRRYCKKGDNDETFISIGNDDIFDDDVYDSNEKYIYVDLVAFQIIQ